ncbi:hypothetical protein IF2G_00936 [Cordyceps javanica]|nr:hypothetical protein IF2G_00936 [Cordyceps javanica]
MRLSNRFRGRALLLRAMELRFCWGRRASVDAAARLTKCAHCSESSDESPCRHHLEMKGKLLVAAQAMAVYVMFETFGWRRARVAHGGLWWLK